MLQVCDATGVWCYRCVMLQVCDATGVYAWRERREIERRDCLEELLSFSSVRAGSARQTHNSNI